MIRPKKCPLCGREQNDSMPFAGSVCIDCFLKNKFKEKIAVKIIRCPICGRLYIRGRWIEFDESTLYNYIAQEIEKQLNRILRDYGLEVFVNVFAEEVEAIISEERAAYKWKVPAEISYEQRVCMECSRRLSGYHEAIIQFRGEGGSLTDKEKNRVKRELEKLPTPLQESIVEVKELKEGLDVKVYDQPSARAIVSFFAQRNPSTVKESHKLITIRGGVKKTRLSISVRVHRPIENELMSYNNKPALVRYSGEGKVEVTVIPERRKIFIRYEEVQSKLRPYRDPVSKVLITTISPKEVYFMDIKGTFELDSIPMEYVVGIPEEGKEAYIISYNNRRYLVCY